MRLPLLLALLPLPALAQQIPETPAPPAISAQLASDPEFDSATAWVLDLDRDGDADWLVQGMYPAIGGNSVGLRYLMFRNDAGVPVPAGELSLLGSIMAVRLEGSVLVITLSQLRDGDARCCPTGVAEMRYAL